MLSSLIENIFLIFFVWSLSTLILLNYKIQFRSFCLISKVAILSNIFFSCCSVTNICLSISVINLSYQYVDMYLYICPSTLYNYRHIGKSSLHYPFFLFTYLPSSHHSLWLPLLTPSLYLSPSLSHSPDNITLSFCHNLPFPLCI